MTKLTDFCVSTFHYGECGSGSVREGQDPPLRLDSKYTVTERVREETISISLWHELAVRLPDMESPGIVDQTIPGCPRKERDKKMIRRLKMYFFLDIIIAPLFLHCKDFFI